MSRQPFYETESESRWWFGITGRVILGVLLLMILSTLFAGITFGFNTLISPFTGRGHAYQRQQSSDNRIFAQQQFQDLYTDYQSTVAKIPTYVQAAKSGDTAAQTNLAGITSHCADVVGQYNAAAQKYLTAQFRDANLPPTLDYAACKADRG